MYYTFSQLYLRYLLAILLSHIKLCKFPCKTSCDNERSHATTLLHHSTTVVNMPLGITPNVKDNV